MPSTAPHRRIVVARPLEADSGDELDRVSWAKTVLRLALEPSAHPWQRGWRFRHPAPLAVLLAAVLLLLLFAASGCASTPRLSLTQGAAVPPPAPGPRCDSLLVSQEVPVPREGRVGELRVTLRDIPEVTGPLRVLVRQPRFEASLAFDGQGPADFDKVIDVPPSGRLALVLSRPRGAPSDWPRRSCKACRVEVELTGLFGAREGFDEFFGRAMREAAAIDSAFARQGTDVAAHPGPALHEAGARLVAEGRRCGVPLDPIVDGVEGALVQLAGARAELYGAEVPRLPDAAAVGRAFRNSFASIEAMPPAAFAARRARWTAALKLEGPLRAAMLNLHLALQAASLTAENHEVAARWIALAAVPDTGALEKRTAELPRIRDLEDARSRLAWIDPPAGALLPLPGLAPATLSVPWFRAAPRGRRCIGPGGAAPVRDKSAEAAVVAALLGADQSKLRVARPADLPAVRAALARARDLLCEPPAPEVDPLFAGLQDRELGAVSERLEAIYAEVDPRRERDEIAQAVAARTSRLLCGLLSPESVERRVTSVVGYRIFVEGGTRVLDFVPGPLICDKRAVWPRAIRARLREAYRAALDRHAADHRLCPGRGSRCPEEVAASVRRLFGLQAPELAGVAPADGRELDYPPPFGFSDAWVAKLDRCGREACEALSRLRAAAPAGQFEGPVCPPPAETSDHPQDVTLDRPEAPSSVTLSSCDPHAGVRLTLHRRPEAGTLVAIASSHPFRYGSESVTRQGRHPQLGRIFERVADLGNRADVTVREADVFEVALTPTVENQVFWFFTLRRRDY